MFKEKKTLFLIFWLTLFLTYSPTSSSASNGILRVRISDLTLGTFSSYSYQVEEYNGTDYVYTDLTGSAKECKFEFELWNPSDEIISVTAVDGCFYPSIYWTINYENDSIKITQDYYACTLAVSQVDFGTGITVQTRSTDIKFEAENLSSLPKGTYTARYFSSLRYDTSKNYGVTFIKNDTGTFTTYELDSFPIDDVNSLDDELLFHPSFLFQVTFLLLIVFVGSGYSRKRRR